MIATGGFVILERVSVPSSSAPMSRLYPTTSLAKTAVRRLSAR
jgi:hypothetical protein